jgi:hypothetical protein
VSYGLVRAGRCFARFARNEYFTASVVRDLRAFAAGVFAAGVTGLLVPSLVGYLINTWGAVNALRVGIELSSHQVLLLLFSAAVWQIAAVMARAGAIAEEHAQFV